MPFRDRRKLIRKRTRMPFRDKLIIALTVLLLIVGPYLTYRVVEDAMRAETRLVNVSVNSAIAPAEREATDIKPRYLPPIVIGQVVMLITAQVGMVILSAMLIRQHKRRKRLAAPLPRQ